MHIGCQARRPGDLDSDSDSDSEKRIINHLGKYSGSQAPVLGFTSASGLSLQLKFRVRVLPLPVFQVPPSPKYHLLFTFTFTGLAWPPLVAVTGAGWHLASPFIHRDKVRGIIRSTVLLLERVRPLARSLGSARQKDCQCSHCCQPCTHPPGSLDNSGSVCND